MSCAALTQRSFFQSSQILSARFEENTYAYFHELSKASPGFFRQFKHFEYFASPAAPTKYLDLENAEVGLA